MEPLIFYRYGYTISTPLQLGTDTEAGGRDRWLFGRIDRATDRWTDLQIGMLIDERDRYIDGWTDGWEDG